MENHHFQKTANRLNQSYSITVFNSQLKLPKLPEDYHQWRAKGSTRRNRRCFEVCDMWVALAQAHERLGGSCRGCLGCMAPKKDREARTHHTWIVLSYCTLSYSPFFGGNYTLYPQFFWAGVDLLMFELVWKKPHIVPRVWHPERCRRLCEEAWNVRSVFGIGYSVCFIGWNTKLRGSFHSMTLQRSLEFAYQSICAGSICKDARLPDP
jgi:hypothetical protein